MKQVQPKLLTSNDMGLLQHFNSLFGKYTPISTKDLTEAHEAVESDMVNELISRLIEIVEKEATIEYDENEDGSFTSVVIDTPNTRELLKDAILDNYSLETK